MNLLTARDEFLEWLKAKGYSPQTVRLRSGYLREFIAFVKNQSLESIEEVTAGHVDEYRGWVSNRNHMVTGRKLSPVTVFHHFETIRVFFGYLIGRKLLLADPSAHLEWKNRRQEIPKNIPTEEEMEQVLARPDTGTLTGLRDRAILELIYSTGLRREETANLNLYDLNMAGGTLMVRCGKGGKGRTVPVGESALHFLARYLNEARPRMMKWLGRETSGGRETALFVKPGGGRLSKAMVGIMAGRHVKEVKPEATLGCHAIRHAFATHMLKGGASLAAIQRIMGHTNLSSTEIYLQVKPVDLKEEHRKTHPRRKE